MRRMKIAVVLLAALSVAAHAAADLKIVKKVHRDGYTVMGQTQPADDTVQTTWIGTDRMHMDMGDRATIVRMDEMKLYAIDHTDETYSVLELPVDLEQLLPPQMKPMLEMMQFEVTVTPVEEQRQIGPWKARRFDVEMTTQVMSMKITQWAADVAGYDPATFSDMYVHLNSLQPGMASAVQELRKVDGYVVAQESVVTMMGNDITSTEQVESIEELAPPPGIYAPPQGYSETPYDFMAAATK